MAQKRRIYTPEFKAEAVKLVTERGYSFAEAARSLGVTDNLVRNWKQALQAQGDQRFPGRERSPPSRRRTAASAPTTKACGPSATS